MWRWPPLLLLHSSSSVESSLQLRQTRVSKTWRHCQYLSSCFSSRWRITVCLVSSFVHNILLDIVSFLQVSTPHAFNVPFRIVQQWMVQYIDRFKFSDSHDFMEPDCTAAIVWYCCLRHGQTSAKWTRSRAFNFTMNGNHERLVFFTIGFGFVVPPGWFLRGKFWRCRCLFIGGLGFHHNARWWCIGSVMVVVHQTEHVNQNLRFLINKACLAFWHIPSDGIAV